MGFFNPDIKTEITKKGIRIIRISKTEPQKESKILAQEKLYEDDGLGVMISNGMVDRAKKGYLQWKKDYPERARRVVAATISFEKRLIVFYNTE